MKTSVLELQNISIGYQNKQLISNINLSIEEGKFIGLLGRNGSGKSTLIGTIAGLLPALSGNILINGNVVNSKNFKRNARLLSIVLTHNTKIENMNVFDFVAMGRQPHTSWMGKLTAYDKNIIHRTLEQTSLSTYRNRLLHELSDGEFQKAVIARTIAQDTPLVLLDEPTSHLDLPNRIEIISMLKKLAVENKKAVLIATHELHTAKKITDEIWLVSKDNDITCCNTCNENLNKHINNVFNIENKELIEV